MIHFNESKIFFESYSQLGEPNPDSLGTMHSTKRVRIGLSHCVMNLKSPKIYEQITIEKDRKAFQFI